MSRATMQGVEDAITAHLRDIGVDAQVNAWGVVVELTSIDEHDGVVYTNNYAVSGSSPNTLFTLFTWGAAQVESDGIRDYYDPDA